jgi:hypothetical protein
MIDCFIYEGLERWLKELDAENPESDNDKNFRGMHLYISVCANIKLPMKEAGLPLEPMTAA